MSDPMMDAFVRIFIAVCGALGAIFEAFCSSISSSGKLISRMIEKSLFPGLRLSRDSVNRFQ